MKFIKIFIVSLLLILLSFEAADAAVVNVTASAQTANKINYKNDNADIRTAVLKKFFDRYNSPLSEYSSYFVYYADLYNVDWRLVPAISGVESTFGKRIPYNSYNAYGWVQGGYKFKSWEESIEAVNKGLRENYLNKGANTLSRIAKRYCPPGSANWESGVRFFIKKIDLTPLTFDI